MRLGTVAITSLRSRRERAVRDTFRRVAESPSYSSPMRSMVGRGSRLALRVLFVDSGDGLSRLDV